jgi:hypothetical protein
MQCVFYELVVQADVRMSGGTYFMERYDAVHLKGTRYSHNLNKQQHQQSVAAHKAIILCITGTTGACLIDDCRRQRNISKPVAPQYTRPAPALHVLPIDKLRRLHSLGD